MLRRSRALALIALGIALGLATGAGSGTYSAFSKTTSNDSNVVTAKRIFPGVTRSTSGWTFTDSADASSADNSDPLGIAGDAKYKATGNFATTFSATRYFQFDMYASLPASVPVSGVTFDLNYLPNAGADTGCFYFEVVRTSTSAVLGTHGSSTTPVSCGTGTTPTTTSTALPEITSTDTLNDISIKVYAKESGGKPMKWDFARVAGTYTYGGSFTTMERRTIDSSTGTAGAAVPWGPAASDGTNFYQTQGNWATTFATTRYLQLTLPTFVPSGVTITSATFVHRYKSSGAGKKTCFYYEFWSGATMLARYGSTASATPTYCSDTLGNWQTDTLSVPEVNTPAKANGLVIKMFGFDTGPTKSNHDLITFGADYYLD